MGDKRLFVIETLVSNKWYFYEAYEIKKNATEQLKHNRAVFKSQGKTRKFRLATYHREPIREP